MTDPYFTSSPLGYEPGPEAFGPWSPEMLHGRLLGGLAARDLERELVEPGWRVARLTVDLFRPAAMAPVQCTPTVVRTGRRIRVADSLLTCEGHEVARVAAVALTTSPEPPGRIWRPAHDPWPHPDTLDPPVRLDDEEGPAWIVRTVAGGFDTGEQTRLWSNDTAALVDDEPMSPLVRTAISSDLACPIANSSDDGLHYINADYTVAIGRYPVGGWVGLEVAQQLAADGISMASATLFDLDGPFATSTGVSLTNPRLQTDDEGSAG